MPSKKEFTIRIYGCIFGHTWADRPVYRDTAQEAKRYLDSRLRVHDKLGRIGEGWDISVNGNPENGWYMEEHLSAEINSPDFLTAKITRTAEPKDRRIIRYSKNPDNGILPLTDWDTKTNTEKKLLSLFNISNGTKYASWVGAVNWSRAHPESSLKAFPTLPDGNRKFTEKDNVYIIQTRENNNI